MWAILRERNNCTFNEVQVSVIQLKILLGSCTLGTCSGPALLELVICIRL